MDRSAELFGSVAKATSTGDHPPDLNHLRRISDGGKIPIHCQSCGNKKVTIRDPDAANKFAAKIGQEPPDSWVGKFARVQSCPECGDDFSGLTAEDINPASRADISPQAQSSREGNLEL